MFGGSKSIKLKPALLEKIKTAVKLRGASSLEEFVEHIVEREVDGIIAKSGKRAPSQAEVDEITNKMKGLGYLE